MAPDALEAQLALTGALVCLGAVVIAAAGAPSDAAFGRGLLELLIVGGPIAYRLGSGARTCRASARANSS